MNALQRTLAAIGVTVAATALAPVANAAASVNAVASVNDQSAASTITCQLVYEYRVGGDTVVTPPDGGPPVYVRAGDTFHAFDQSNPAQYFGRHLESNRWLSLPVAILEYTGNSWCV